MRVELVGAKVLGVSVKGTWLGICRLMLSFLACFMFMLGTYLPWLYVKVTSDEGDEYANRSLFAADVDLWSSYPSVTVTGQWDLSRFFNFLSLVLSLSSLKYYLFTYTNAEESSWSLRKTGFEMSMYCVFCAWICIGTFVYTTETYLEVHRGLITLVYMRGLFVYGVACLFQSIAVMFDCVERVHAYRVGSWTIYEGAEEAHLVLPCSKSDLNEKDWQ